MLLCQFVYNCTHFAAICFTIRHLSESCPFSLRICTAQYFFLCLGHPGEDLYLYYEHFSLFFIIN